MAEPPKPKVYAFINGSPWPGDYAVVALAEDGTFLASHISSSEQWARNDIGATDPVTPQGLDKHRVYGKHYPGGYEVEWVERDAVAEHDHLQAALKRNRSTPGHVEQQLGADA